MGKKLQLSEIKVNSFITPVNKNDQKTTKGGYVHREDMVSLSNDVSYAEEFTWTELKTRVSTNDISNLFSGGNLR
jgi:hypothetical protein